MTSAQKPNEALPDQPAREYYSVSSAQLRLWFLHQLEPESGRYHLTRAVRIEGAFDSDAYCWAVSELIKRQDSLRTTFHFHGTEPVQIVSPECALDVYVTDCAEEDEAKLIINAECARPFDLEHGPLFRTGVIRVQDDLHYLYVAMHHIISDLTSLNIFIEEATALIAGRLLGPAFSLPLLTYQYCDYAALQCAQLNSTATAEQIEYWKANLSDVPPLLRLPCDYPRPSLLSDRGARVSFQVDEDISRQIREFCAREGVTLQAGVLAAFQTLLSRYAGERTIVTGVVVPARHKGWEHVIGLFSNTIALKTTIEPGIRFRVLLQEVSERLIEALDRTDAPFDVIVEHLQPARSLAHHPIFQNVLLLEEESREVPLGNARMIPVDRDTQFTRFDLTLTLGSRDAGGLAGCLIFSTDLFERSTVERMGKHFAVLLRSIVADPDCAADELSMITPEEAAAITGPWNATARDYPRNTGVHRLFEAKVREAPDSVAIWDSSRAITYLELNASANRIARALVAAGALPGGFVAVTLPPSADVVAAMFAVLKTGNAYLMLDPSDSTARNLDQLRDSGVRIAIIGPGKGYPGIRCIPIESTRVGFEDGNLNWDGSGAAAAYVMYTSGSTGRPKGVVVPHRGIARLVLNTNYVDFRPEDRVAQVSTLLFDGATFEIFGALINGAAMVMIPREVALSPPDFATIVDQYKITISFLTTSLFNQLVSSVPRAFHGFRYVLAGGEAVDSKVFADLFRTGYRGRLVDAYGPTEATTFSICNVLESWDQDTVPVPIGRPITNGTAYVLSRGLRLLPPGVVGEICVGGDGVALQYLNNEEATREKFPPNPFIPGERLYRTGDLGRYRADGQIEFLGRMDRQLKIRGFRIEPAEIERTIESHSEVKQAAVLVVGTKSADQRLAAFVVRQPDSLLSESGLLAWLKRSLSSYLLPWKIVFLNALPLTPNGKLDTSELKVPSGESASNHQATDEFTPMESFARAAWKRVLNIEAVDRNSDFFSLGGTSLSAVRMSADLARVLGRNVPVGLLLRAPILREFAEALMRSSNSPDSKLFCIRECDSESTPLVLVHAGGDYSDLLPVLSIPNPVWTLSLPTATELSGSPSLQQIAALYGPELRSVFGDRSMVFAGYCISGLVAFELTRQQAQETGKTAPVVLFDAPSPPHYWKVPISRRLGGLAKIATHQAKRLMKESPRNKVALMRKFANRMHAAENRGQDSNVQEKVMLSALLSYRPDRYPGAVLLLRASSDPAEERDFGWGAFATRVEVYDTPCIHGEILNGTNAPRAAEVLAAAMRLDSNAPAPNSGLVK